MVAASYSEPGTAFIDAMKMKTTIVANHAGTVARLLVSPGESVDGGQALLEIQ